MLFEKIPMHGKLTASFADFSNLAKLARKDADSSYACICPLIRLDDLYLLVQTETNVFYK